MYQTLKKCVRRNSKFSKFEVGKNRCLSYILNLNLQQTEVVVEFAKVWMLHTSIHLTKKNGFVRKFSQRKGTQPEQIGPLMS